MSLSMRAATASNILYDDTAYDPPHNGDDDGGGQSNITLEYPGTICVPSAKIALIPNSYVPFLATIPASNTIAALVSNNISDAVWSIDISTALPVRKYTSTGRTSALRATPTGCSIRSSFMTAARDRAIRMWDQRSADPVATINARHPLLSFDISPVDGALLAAGTDNDAPCILFWDIRNTARTLYVHESTHSDDITAVHFHPTKDILLSGSSDGLLCLTDPRQPDEDEAVEHVRNWENSVSRCGWDGDQIIWSASDMETFALWDYQLNEALDFGDLRKPMIQDIWESNYIIDAGPTTLHPGGEPCTTIWMGSNVGDFALFHAYTNEGSRGRVDIPNIFSPSPGGGVAGHTAIVRSILHIPETRCIVSGGEDASICLWQVPEQQQVSIEPNDGDQEMRSPSPPSPPKVKRHRKRKTEDDSDEEEVVSSKRGRSGF